MALQPWLNDPKVVIFQHLFITRLSILTTFCQEFDFCLSTDFRCGETTFRVTYNNLTTGGPKKIIISRSFKHMKLFFTTNKMEWNGILESKMTNEAARGKFELKNSSLIKQKINKKIFLVTHTKKEVNGWTHGCQNKMCFTFIWQFFGRKRFFSSSKQLQVFNLRNHSE